MSEGFENQYIDKKLPATHGVSMILYATVLLYDNDANEISSALFCLDTCLQELCVHASLKYFPISVL